MHPWHAKVVNSHTPMQKDTTSLQKISPVKRTVKTSLIVFLKAIKMNTDNQLFVLCPPLQQRKANKSNNQFSHKTNKFK